MYNKKRKKNSLYQDNVQPVKMGKVPKMSLVLVTCTFFLFVFFCDPCVLFTDALEQSRRWLLIGQYHYTCRCEEDMVHNFCASPGYKIHNAEKTDIHGWFWPRVISYFLPEAWQLCVGQCRHGWQRLFSVDQVVRVLWVLFFELPRTLKIWSVRLLWPWGILIFKYFQCIIIVVVDWKV